MGAETLQSALTSLLGVVGIAYVLTRRGRYSAVQWMLLSVLAFLSIWTAGLALRFSATTDAEARWALIVTYFGAQGLGPAWLLFALRFTSFRPLERRPGLGIAICAPAPLFLLALLTNDGHRLFARSLSAEDLAQGTLIWAGPIYWAGLVWSFVLVWAGVVAFTAYARKLFAQRGRVRGTTLALAGIIPTFAVATHYTGLVTYPADPTPLATAFAVAIAFYMTLRYRLLDVLPTARRDVIDQLSDGVLIADVEGVIVDLNPRAAALLGRKPSEVYHGLLSRTLARIASDPEAQAIERELDARLPRGESVSVSLRTRDGRDFQLDASCVRDRDGEPTGQYAILRDVTDTRRHERLIRESQQRVVIGGLAASIAHEVNNPLSFVASNLQQIHRAVDFQPGMLAGLPAKRAEELRELPEVVLETIEGVERIAQIVGRIIRPVQIGEDEVRRLDPAQIVRDAVGLVEFHRQYAVPVTVGAVDGLPAVDGSPERLSQALLNVLLGAQEMARSAPDASVRVDASLDGAAVVLRIALESWSLPAPLSNPHRSEETQAELSAAYEIVREHGGTLESGDGSGGVLYAIRLPTQPSVPGDRAAN